MSLEKHEAEDIEVLHDKPDDLEDAITDLTEVKLLLSNNDTQKRKDSILIRTCSFGLNGLFLSTHLATNSKLLSQLGPEGAAAGSLMSTYMSLVFGGSIGILLSTGLVISTPIVEKKYREAGNIAKTAWMKTIFLGNMCTVALISTRWLFPLLFEAKTAKIASDFFSSYSLAGIPFLSLVTGPQIAFQADDWYIPPATMFLYFTIAGVSSYWLGFTQDLGALGIGLGGPIAGITVGAAMQAWFLRGTYREYQLYQWFIENFVHHWKDLFSKGWKLSLQRLTEWGNLFLTTTAIGARDNNALKAAQAGIVYIILNATSTQGLAHATGMLIKKNKVALDSALREGRYKEAESLHTKNIRILLLNNACSLTINGLMATSFYFAREPLTNFFLSADTDQQTRELAEKLLWINMLGLLPDAVRLVTAGALRGWEDLLYPTMISILTMIVFAIPAGIGISQLIGNEAELLFYARDIAMVVAAGIIAKRAYRRLGEDKTSIENAKRLSFFSNQDSEPDQQAIRDLEAGYQTNLYTSGSNIITTGVAHMQKQHFWAWEAKKYSENSELQYLGFMALLKKHKFRGDEEVLDVGSGNGRITYELATQFVPRGSVLGIDACPGMVTEAQSRYQNNNLTFQLGDAKDLSSLKRQFDVVVSSFVLHWVPDKTKVFQEIYGCLKPEGKALIIVPHRNQITAQIRQDIIVLPEWKDYFIGYPDPTLEMENCAYEEYAKSANLEVTSHQEDVTTNFRNEVDLKNFLRTLTPHLDRLPSEELKEKFMNEVITRYLKLVPADTDHSCHITYTYVSLYASKSLELPYIPEPLKV